ncbi:MAG: glucans biosynthesis glucosyltransferase MdoH [Microvirga sp.]
MDALRPIEIATAAPAPILAPGPAMPPESPLAMPVQALSRWSRAEERQPAASDPYRPPWLARLFVFAGAAALTAYGAYEMYQVVSVSRTTVLQWLLLLLFTVNFSWIALAFTSGLLGFVSLLRRPRRLPPLPATLRSRTAVVMPVYNESTARTFAALAAMREEIEATGLGEHFDYFVLSDSTDPDAWIAEERAFLAWRQELGADARVHYRHRPKNHHRKAGNIADFVTRWGGAYDHMLVLDADSLMTGECIARLALAMEEDPDAGIIQTLPLIINRNTLFARAQQFAAKVYGPVVAAGLSVWSGRDGNYWGHNAIIRTRAFAACCGLPDLPGRPPLGGHVLSHDFVEAALMRRAGWAIHMAPLLGGSYEESPPSLTEYAARDRRWCQGNLQHMGVLPARGLHWVTRLHLATGIGAYVAAPLWLFFLITGILISLQAQFIRPEYFPKTFTLYPQWPAQDPVRAAYVFVAAMGLLLAPKLIGYLAMLPNRALRKGFGGGLRAFFSMLAETLISGLIAPVMMLIQSISVIQILSGRDSGWNAQRRDDGTLPLRDAVRRYGWHTAFGLLLALAAYEVSASLFAWMTPVIVGLILAVPLAQWTASPETGRRFRGLKLLLTPEESRPPEILLRANALVAEFSTGDQRGALERLFADPALLAAHRAMLPATPTRKPGEVDVTRVVALAKLDDCATLQQATAVLTRAEIMALLSDGNGLQRLAALDRGQPALKSMK